MVYVKQEGWEAIIVKCSQITINPLMALIERMDLSCSLQYQKNLSWSVDFAMAIITTEVLV